MYKRHLGSDDDDVGTGGLGGVRGKVDSGGDI